MMTEIKYTQAVAIQPAPATNGALAGRVCAGYTLQERLGVGGYGEVWRATGPGGLHKAVKILHGFQDGPQAEAELKSLERVRDLRHPFLLNIERIEVADGRLVIVTELAEGSLEDRFEQLRREGRPGIPRDELLACLRDAADALDFMFEQHGLQHLDIKPANLLLQGGRVKVADFGLIKDVRQTQLSIVGGFTPRFAPPELFEGRPSRNSDQYSLAIVYQLLVSGEPPFAGRTTAQLAAQHLSSQPDLSPLSPADRPIVGRALSKNPHTRFPGCRAFVDQLSERSSTHARSRPVRPAPPGGRDQGDGTQPVRDNGGRQPLRSIPLGAITLNGEPVRYRPTVVVGLGGLGGAVLRSLRRRLHSRFGTVPTAQLLYLDTDLQAISALVTGEDGLRKSDSECIPLRRPDEYRRSSRNVLEWLSRRWLFNIPRSGQVQGIRPLGRLAFVDHQERIRERMRQCLTQAISPDAAEDSRSGTGLPVEPLPPDIVIVASVSGGTGGGAVLDAAYLLRQQLLELELEGGRLIGVLLHATAADAQLGTIQRANALASLRELKHFHSPLGYPGDAACRLPQAATTPFDHVYFVQLGEGLSSDGFERGVESVSDYLYRGACTAARRFLEACRDTDDPADAQARGTFLRSFGVSAMASTGRSAAGSAAHPLCQAVLRGLWSGSPAAGGSGNLQNWADRLMGELELRPEQVQALTARLLGGELGQQLDRQLRDRLAAHAPGAPAGFAAARAIVEAISGNLDRVPPGGDLRAMADVMQSIREELAVRVRDALTSLRGRTLADSQSARLGICGALNLTRDVAERAERLAAEMAAFISSLDREFAVCTERCQPGSNRGTAAGAAIDPQAAELPLYEYGMLAICACVHKAVADSIQVLRAGLSEWEQTLALSKQRLRGLEECFGGLNNEPPTDIAGGSGSSDTEPSLPMIQQLREAAAALLGTSDPERLTELVKMPADALEQVAVRLSHRAASLALGGNTSHAPHRGPEASGHTRAEVAWPCLTNAGGGHRVLAVTPMESIAADWKRQLEQDFGPCVTLEVDPGAEPFLCCESQQLDYQQVETSLTSGNERIAEMASRLHTRADVAWGEG